MALNYRRILRGIWCVLCASLNLILLLICGMLLQSIARVEHWCGLYEQRYSMCHHGVNGAGIIECVSLIAGFAIASWLVIRHGIHLWRVFTKQPLPPALSVPIEFAATLAAYALVYLPIHFALHHAAIN